MSETDELVVHPSADAERVVDVGAPFDLARSLRPWTSGIYDPTGRVEKGRVTKATRTEAGPGTICFDALSEPGHVRVRGWGPGAASLLARAETLLGIDDRPETFVPRHRVIERMWDDHPGMRLSRAPSLFEALVPIVLEQRVTTREALRSWTRLVKRLGEPAPGPFALHLPPAPDVLARMPYYAYHPFGVEQRRADTIRRLAARARRVDALAAEPLAAARRKLASFPGVGPWTLALAAGAVLGDADAVPIGDVHLPNEVAWLLAREPRADDARMLELLAPYAGHRYRIIRLVHMTGTSSPRFGPRQPGMPID